MKNISVNTLGSLLALAAVFGLAGCSSGGEGSGFEFTEFVEPDQGGGSNMSLTNLTNNDPNLFEPTKVIADFEDIAFVKNPANGWVVTGIFDQLDDWTGIAGTRASAARVGTKAVSTCEIGGLDCDSHIGSILTPPFTINDDYINFLMTGGATPVGVQLRLAATGSVLLAFQPNTCAKPTIDSNDDWFHFDVRAIRGQEVQLYIFDNETGGCGFLSFDHFYQSDSNFGASAGSTGEPISGVNVTLPEDGISNIIGTFDDAVQLTTSSQFGGDDWLATGDLENPQVPGAYQGASISDDAARIGERAFSSCSTSTSGCASLSGTLTSPAFQVTQDFVYFLGAGGSATNSDVSIKLLRAATDEELVSFTPQTCDPGYVDGDDDWYKFDVTQIQGQFVKFQVVDNSTDPCGFIAVEHAYQSSNVSFPDADGNTVVPGDAGLADIPLEFKSFNVDIARDAFEDGRIVGNFDDPLATLADGWIATGSFANPADSDAWSGTTVGAAAAHVGGRSVSTCEMNGNAEGCDAPVGTLTSPITGISEDYLYFLMAGGNGDAPVGLRILDSIGNLLHTYQPNSCGPSFIDSNDDWTYIGLQQIFQASVRVQIFDEEPGGCGFVSFDHIYQSSRDPNVDDGTLPVPPINGGDVSPTPVQLKALTYNGVTLPFADSDETVIGDFDDAQQMLADGWVATGTFMAPPAADTWSFLPDNVDAGRVGAHSMSTCEINMNAEGCDAPVGTLTSPAFTVTAAQPILSFAMVGGNTGGAIPVGLQVLDAADDSVLMEYRPEKCGPPWFSVDDDWQMLDLTAMVGTSIKVRVFDNEAGGCGFLAVDHIHMTDGVVADPSAVVGDPAEQLTFVTAPADAFEQVVGNFDDAIQMIADGWVATGTFMMPSSPDAWASLTATFADAARVGTRAVTTCEIEGPGTCDSPTGSLTSPPFMVDAARPNLNFLMSGGNGGAAPVGVRVFDAGNNEIAAFTPDSCGDPVIKGDQHWATIDLSAQAGSMVTVQIFDEEMGGCGFISFDHVHMSATVAQLP